MRNLYGHVLIIFFVGLIIGCKGCSHSGRNSLRNDSLASEKQRTPNDRLENETNKIEFDPISKKTLQEANGNLTELYKLLSPAVLYILTGNDHNGLQGTGFIVSPDGICVSNYHVFKGTFQENSRIFVGDAEYSVTEVIYKSDDLDCIVFRINGSDLPFLQLASNIPNIGEEVFAIGNPQGLEKTLSTGIISQIRDNGTIIQTTAEITHGSSGGPLFNMKGEVIGITTSGFNEANLNFAINIQKIPFQSINP